MIGFITTEIINEVGYITFSHPQSNSMPGENLMLLAESITKIGQNDEVKVIVLQSNGENAFCAGASFDELAAINDLQTGEQFFSGFAKVINAMRKTPKFIIARIQGKTVGGGVGIACSADYALAHTSASVKLSELAVGIGPFVVGPAVERKIGKGAFCELTINATEWQTASWAKEKSMYVNTFNSITELDIAIDTLCKKLVNSSPEAMKTLKKIMWQDCENWDSLLMERAKISGTLVLSDFTKNAISKFKAGNR